MIISLKFQWIQENQLQVLEQVNAHHPIHLLIGMVDNIAVPQVLINRELALPWIVYLVKTMHRLNVLMENV